MKIKKIRKLLVISIIVISCAILLPSISGCSVYNMIKEIYTRDEVEYAEINLNDFTYRVKEDNPISDIYLVQTINEDSVALLKGDEIINISIGEIVYD